MLQRPPDEVEAFSGNVMPWVGFDFHGCLLREGRSGRELVASIHRQSLRRVQGTCLSVQLSKVNAVKAITRADGRGADWESMPPLKRTFQAGM